jgi:hypothetical protein
LANLASSPERVVAYARELRESIRQMPFLRSSGVWSECTANLRLAWGRLDANAISDPELLFFIHETLTDREVTTLRSLPPDTRLLALRHLHTRRTPSALVQAVEADPRLPLQLEHQRTVEWWSISSLLRERADLAKTAWVSLVRRGDSESGKYSLIIQTRDKRHQSQDRVKGDWSPVVQEIAAVCKDAEHILVAADAELPGLDRASYIPSWEWAFRVLREPVPAVPSRVEVLRPEGSSAEAPAGILGVDCLLAGRDEAVDASTVWISMETGERVRSLGIGAHPRVTSMAPVRKGALKEDLVRLCLAQATARFVTCDTIVRGVPR